MKKILGDYDTDRIKFLNSQDVEDEVADGVAILKELYETMKDDKREKTHISELKIGTECGGSDAFSGLTGNPLVGKLSDFLICQGGTTVLTEVPEMFGAETILMERAKDEEVFKKIVKMINDYKKYLQSYNVPIYENPSYGNKEGGITTLEEKSLGCTQKSGDAPVVDVIGHNEFIREKGLNLYDCPSDDAIEATALGAIGCQMVLFTTGRGTPLGSFVPTLKISTNSKMGTLKKKWIDFDAGRLLEEPMEDLLEDFISLIVDTANGKMTKNEINDSREVSIWKIGPTV
jgi:altronate hydrolase